jgi:hypothetical protein
MIITINLTATIKAPNSDLFRIERNCAPNGSDLFQAVDPFWRSHSGTVDDVVARSATHVKAGSFGGEATAGLDAAATAASAGGSRYPPISGRRCC